MAMRGLPRQPQNRCDLRTRESAARFQRIQDPAPDVHAVESALLSTYCQHIKYFIVNSIGDSRGRTCGTGDLAEERGGCFLSLHEPAPI
jgi:hypothetical protein